MSISTRFFLGASLVVCVAGLPAFGQAQPAPAATFEELLEQIKKGNPDDTATPAPLPPATEAPAQPARPGKPDMPTAPKANTLPTRVNQAPSAKPLPRLNEDAFAFTISADQTATHTMSSLACPATLGTWKRVELRQYSFTGHDVSCNYQGTSAPGLLTFFFSGYGSAGEPAKVVEKVRNQLQGAGTSVKPRSSGAIEVPFAGIPMPCEEATFSFTGGSAGPGITAVQACLIGGWSFKVRYTGSDKAGLPRQDIETFAKMQRPVINRIQKCEAFNIAVSKAERSNAKGLTYNADGMEYVPAGDGCFMQQSGGKDSGFLIQNWPDNPDTPWTVTMFDASGPIGDKPFFRVQNMWARTPEVDRGEGGYLLIREEPDATMTVYNGFSRIPNLSSVLKATDEAINGTTKPNLVAKRNAGGGFTMAAQ